MAAPRIPEPLVSVVIPSYNHGAFVTEAVRSALDQSVDGLEVVVVDDGSRDDSLERLRAIADPRLTLLSQENQGAHRALDRGLRAARGRYLAILNSDDAYAPRRLETILAVLADDPRLALAGSWIEVVDEAGRTLGVKEGFRTLAPWPVEDPSADFTSDGDLRTALLCQNYWSTTSNFVFPRATYDEIGPFRPLRFVHDWDFALRVQLDRPAHLVPEPLVRYRVHGTNTIRSDRATMVFEICWLLAFHLPRYLGQAGFWEPGAARRALQLLRSTPAHGCDSVLWGMAAVAHLGPEGSAEALLREGDPLRETYLAEIRRRLEAGPPAALPPSTASLRSRLSALARRLGRG